MKHASKFIGQDAERLARCIAAAAAAGHAVGGLTIAGINSGSGHYWLWDDSWSAPTQSNPGNPGSGNVWVYDSGWMGGVVCRPDMTMFWVHECPKCNKEHTFDSYDVLKDYVTKHGYCCASCFVAAGKGES